LPHIGNKVIACITCKLDIHGTKRTPTWSELKYTFTREDDPNEKKNVDDGDFDIITLVDNIDGNTLMYDWEIGDEIVIASTSFYHKEAETFKII